MATKRESIASSIGLGALPTKRPRSARAHEQSHGKGGTCDSEQAEVTLMAIVSAAHAAGSIARRVTAGPDGEMLRSLAFQLDAIALLADAALSGNTTPGTWLIGGAFDDVRARAGGSDRDTRETRTVPRAGRR
jgi:hypothetical protein